MLRCTNASNPTTFTSLAQTCLGPLRAVCGPWTMAQYRGWDLEAMKLQSGISDAQPFPSSAFTAINSPTLGQQVTPQPSASASTIAAQPRIRGSRKKARNPAVASYLGIGNATAPSMLDSTFHSSSAPSLPDTPPKSRQERSAQPLRNEKPAKSKSRKSSKKQRQVSDGLPVQKHAVKQLATPKDTPEILLAAPSSRTQPVQSSHILGLSPIDQSSLDTTLQPSIQGSLSTFTACHSGGFQPSLDEAVQPFIGERAPKRVKTTSTPPNTREQWLSHTDSHDIPPSAQGEPPTTLSAGDSSQKTVEAIRSNSQSSSGSIQKPTGVFDDGVEGIFCSPEFDELVDNIFTASPDVEHAEVPPQHHEQAHLGDDAWDDGLNDEDLLSSTAALINNANGDANNPHVISNRLALASPNSNSPPGLDWSGASSSSAIDLSSPRPTVAPFVSPVTDRTGEHIEIASGPVQHTTRPIVRPSFPIPARDRSPIIGLTPNTLLRTCFRIGEAISTGSSAIKHGKNIIIELYARVLSSRRDNIKQYFVFCDLYHKKPPYINATYDAAIWKSVELFDYDSGRLLQEGRTCRCIGKMKRNGKALELVVLNIWETTWEDILWVEGILRS
ncbi:hypothetical protein BDV96DRAFT_571533 [Lophiotrema nucula]|uniref:Uncharacterized protein n=1 Tax=Lophiotrema nucula TaxID=690887 RepID=A0A6A5ZFG6_9PLEO|nr:hypothetical protein BDV96DRAFT_571533 [Lophiotrema nucula]